MSRAVAVGPLAGVVAALAVGAVASELWAVLIPVGGGAIATAVAYWALGSK